jgi:hypothetical protein
MCCSKGCQPDLAGAAERHIICPGKERVIPRRLSGKRGRKGDKDGDQTLISEQWEMK